MSDWWTGLTSAHPLYRYRGIEPITDLPNNDHKRDRRNCDGKPVATKDTKGA